MNKVILLGRMTKDADIRYTQTNNTMIARFSIAVNRRYVKQGEERQADFFNCTAFGKTAETISKYCGKGRQISIIGRLENRNWEDDNGQKHYATDVIVEEMYFADSKKDEDTNGDLGVEVAEFEFDENDLPF